MNKNVLVMGGSYFIGKRIVEEFLNHSYNVYTLNRGTKEIEDHRVNQLTGDRNDVNHMKTLLIDYQFDIVIDVSGVNQKQVEILTESLDIKSLSHYFFISSSAVYDIDYLGIPFKEDDVLASNHYWTSYGTNKIEAEQYLTHYFKDLNTKLVMLRPPYVYGENNYAPRESFIFNHLIKDQPIIIPNKGESLLQFIYTKDLAQIILKLIDVELDPVSIFNVGNKEAITIKDWVLLCAKVVNKKANIIEFDYKKYGRKERQFFPFYDYSNVLNVSKINLLYNEETNFVEGLEKAFIWYRNNQHHITFNEQITKNELEILLELRS